MRALILAGGKGTQLRPLTVYTPKPIVPVLNRPLILYQLEILRRAGIEDVTLSISYQPDKIEHVLGDGSDFGVSLRFTVEPSPMGTAGAYRFAANSRETTVVLNGDIVTDADIDKMVTSHRENKSDATIAVATVANPVRYGLVEIDNERNIQRFVEKPKPEEIDNLDVNTINAGIYILEPSVLDLIPNGENCSFEYNVFPKLLSEKRRFRGFPLDGHYWRDIGTPASYLAANLDFLAGQVKGLVIAPSGVSEIATAADVDKNSIIGEGCTIKPHARIINSVIGPGVHIEEKALIENSVVWSHCRVSTMAEIRNAVIGRSCHIGRNVIVSEGSVLGDKASLPDYSRL